MKSFIAFVLGSTMACVVLGQTQTTNPPPSDVKSVSYALGVNLALGVSNTLRSVETTNIDLEVMLGAMRDLLGGQTPRMTPAEAAAITGNWTNSLRKVIAERNLAAGRAYVEAFSREPGVIKLPSGVCYRVIKEGDGSKPALTDTVTVHYRGTLIDGKEFDSSFSRNQPWDTAVQRVIRGWTEVLQLMKVGSKWHFMVPAEMAYGERGVARGGIPPNAVLVYDLELLAIKPPPGASTNSPTTIR